MNQREARLFDEIFERIIRESYVEGARIVAEPLDLGRYLPHLDTRLGTHLGERASLGRNAVERYIKMVRDFAGALAEQRIEEHAWRLAVDAYARELAEQRAELIVNVELGTARFQGAKDLLAEAGVRAETWDFHHLLTGEEGHDRCPICEEIEAAGPYDQEAAESEGFPDLPHADCDCAWVLRVEGEEEEEVAA